jgi:hypothetical protein
MAAVEHRPEVGFLHPTPQPEPLGQGPDPAAGGFSVAEVVGLGRGGHFAEVVVGGVRAEPADIEHENESFQRGARGPSEAPMRISAGKPDMGHAFLLAALGGSTPFPLAETASLCGSFGKG